MFHDLFYRRYTERQDEKTKSLNLEINRLKQELALEKKESRFQKRRFERIKHVLNDATATSDRCYIETTDKGVNVLSVIRTTGHDKGFEVEIFNIDDIEPQIHRELVLWASMTANHIFIEDIQGGTGKGHGSIAMAHLMAEAKEFNKRRDEPLPITGRLYTIGEDNERTQDAFYKKWGIMVDKVNKRIEFKFKTIGTDGNRI